MFNFQRKIVYIGDSGGYNYLERVSVIYLQLTAYYLHYYDIVYFCFKKNMISRQPLHSEVVINEANIFDILYTLILIV